MVYASQEVDYHDKEDNTSPWNRRIKRF